MIQRQKKSSQLKEEKKTESPPFYHNLTNHAIYRICVTASKNKKMIRRRRWAELMVAVAWVGGTLDASGRTMERSDRSWDIKVRKQIYKNMRCQRETYQEERIWEESIYEYQRPKNPSRAQEAGC